MFKDITIRFQDNELTNYSADLDTNCPHCGLPMNPNILDTISSDISRLNRGTFGIFVACTNPGCGKYHIQAFYYERDDTFHKINRISRINYSYKTLIHNTMPEIVNKTFPAFKIIFDQALQAELLGLDQIAGVGYRKAVEFLVKEYVIHKKPDSSETIKSKFLGKVIDDNLNDFPRLQALSKAAVWIGNDETHFVRVHEDKDLQNMKEFIEASALFISADLKVDEATEFTNRPKQ